MDEYTNNLHARIDNILSDVQNSSRLNKLDPTSQQPHFSNHQSIPNSQHDYSIEIGVCWLIVGVLIGCIICYYSFYQSYDNDDDDNNNNDRYDKK